MTSWFVLLAHPVNFLNRSVIITEGGYHQYNGLLVVAVLDALQGKKPSITEKKYPQKLNPTSKNNLNKSFDKNIAQTEIAALNRILAVNPKDIDKKAIFKAGIEYRIIEKIYVRGGITSDPTLYTFGFGINFKKLKIDFASSMHQTLGYSPQISIIYTFK